MLLVRSSFAVKVSALGRDIGVSALGRDNINSIEAETMRYPPRQEAFRVSTQCGREPRCSQLSQEPKRKDVLLHIRRQLKKDRNVRRYFCTSGVSSEEEPRPREEPRWAHHVSSQSRAETSRGISSRRAERRIQVTAPVTLLMQLCAATIAATTTTTTTRTPIHRPVTAAVAASVN